MKSSQSCRDEKSCASQPINIQIHLITFIKTQFTLHKHNRRFLSANRASQRQKKKTPKRTERGCLVLRKFNQGNYFNSRIYPSRKQTVPGKIKIQQISSEGPERGCLVLYGKCPLEFVVVFELFNRKYLLKKRTKKKGSIE